MKYTVLVALVAFFPAALAVVRDPSVVARNAGTRVTEREELDLLSKRACTATKCSCEGVPDGLFCGDGLLNCVVGDVYQCGDDGKKSCLFGHRDSCAQCNKTVC